MTTIDPKPAIIEEIELTPLAVRGELVAAGPSSQADERPRSFRGYGLFLGAFVLPFALSAVYFMAIVSDRYVSEARFIMRSLAGNGVAGISTMIESQGLSRASDETY